MADDPSSSAARRHPRLWWFFTLISTAGTARVIGKWRRQHAD